MARSPYSITTSASLVPPVQGLLALADHRHTPPFSLSGRTVQAEKIDEPESFAASGAQAHLTF